MFDPKQHVKALGDSAGQQVLNRKNRKDFRSRELVSHKRTTWIIVIGVSRHGNLGPCGPPTPHSWLVRSQRPQQMYSSQVQTQGQCQRKACGLTPQPNYDRHVVDVKVIIHEPAAEHSRKESRQGVAPSQSWCGGEERIPCPSRESNPTLNWSLLASGRWYSEYRWDMVKFHPYVITSFPFICWYQLLQFPSWSSNLRWAMQTQIR
jgi:hypothetical protein